MILQPSNIFLKGVLGYKCSSMETRDISLVQVLERDCLIKILETVTSPKEITVRLKLITAKYNKRYTNLWKSHLSKVIDGFYCWLYFIVYYINKLKEDQ